MSKHRDLTVSQREAIYLGKMQGRSLNQLADEIGCSKACARKWWRVGRKHGLAGLRSTRATRASTATLLSRFDPKVAERALYWKKQYPRRGPTRILLDLAKDESLSGLRLPKRTQLAAYYKQVCPELLAERKARPPAPPRAREVHELWQIDSKENLRLQDGTIATVLHVREPVACVYLGLFAHATQTKKAWRKLTLAETQNDLRQSFALYGLPRGIQTDREHLYGCPAKEAFPTIFTLWLIGLGIAHYFSRPSQPTDQAQVERGHRTWNDYLTTPEPLPDIASLQARLEDARHAHNAELPSRARDCNGRPPFQAHPEVNHVWRPYHPAAEPELFSLDRVDQFLNQFSWQYKVTSIGQVAIQDQVYYIGLASAGKRVDARFDSSSRCFVFSDAKNGEVLKRWPARHLDAATIMNLPFPLPELDRPVQLSFPT
jgi:transposase InsO family protein